MLLAEYAIGTVAVMGDLNQRVNVTNGQPPISGSQLSVEWGKLWQILGSLTGLHFLLIVGSVYLANMVVVKDDSQLSTARLLNRKHQCPSFHFIHSLVGNLLTRSSHSNHLLPPTNILPPLRPPNRPPRHHPLRLRRPTVLERQPAPTLPANSRQSRPTPGTSTLLPRRSLHWRRRRARRREWPEANWSEQHDSKSRGRV